VCSEWNIARKLTSHLLCSYRQTFDKVPHITLLHKLNSNGLSLYHITWFHGNFIDLVLWSHAKRHQCDSHVTVLCISFVVDSRILKGVCWLAPFVAKQLYLVSWEKDHRHNGNNSVTHIHTLSHKTHTHIQHNVVIT